MCEELESVLPEGREHAENLVEHLVEMGADQCSIPVSKDGVEYIVEVRKGKISSSSG